MKRNLTRLNLAIVVAAAVGIGAMAGSARELYGIGVEIGYGWPAAIPLALDGLAVVATALVTMRRDRHALVALIAAGVVSAVLQVGAVLVPLLDPAERSPEAIADAAISVTVHVAVLGAAIFAIHLIARFTATPEDVPAEVAPVLVQPAPSDAARTSTTKATPRGQSAEDIAPRIVSEDVPRKVRDVKAYFGVGDAKARAALALVLASPEDVPEDTELAS